MNDFDYENLQKKRVARSALHRKCGAKSKKCSLPSDHLTAKQRKELNGMEVTYQMNKPVAWNIFKMWPQDIQREYLKGLSERYHVNANWLAGMFCITHSTFVPYCKNHGLTDCVTNRGHMSALELAKWEDFVKLGTAAKPEENDGNATVTVTPHSEEQTVDVPAIMVPVGTMPVVEPPLRCEEPEEWRRTRPTPADFEMSFEVGTDGADTEAVLNFVRELLGEGTNGMLTVRFQRRKNRRSDKKVQGFCTHGGENEA